jgi:P27 family predicted phage terminase small subunit
MGLRGPAPKPSDRRQRRNHGAVVVLRAADAVPEAPAGLLRSTVTRWATFWQSELARATRQPHLPMVERLFTLYDERERSFRVVKRDGRLVMGSQGQPVQNPLLRYIATCDAEIRQLEDRLGLSPKGMAALGTAFAGAQKSLDDLNRDHEEEPLPDDDADPRLEVAG